MKIDLDEMAKFLEGKPFKIGGFALRARDVVDAIKQIPIPGTKFIIVMNQITEVDNEGLYSFEVTFEKVKEV